jgi:hypothetical protein
MKLAALIGALLWLAIPSRAQLVTPPNRVLQYIKTHKFLLASDALLVAARMADAAASVHCQKVNPACTEGGFPIRQIFGPRPPAAGVYSVNAINAAGLVLTSHVFFHYQNAKPDAGGTQFAFVLWTAPACFLSGVATQTAVNVATQQQAARARLMR